MKKLIIHPGLHKSGSTFLQEKFLFKLKNYENLSKNQRDNQSQKSKLIDLQYKLFIPKNSGCNINYPFNLSSRVHDYSEELFFRIDNSKNDNFYLTDVNLADQNNYFGFFNISLLEDVIFQLKKKIDIEIKFILTIRKQYDLLFSWYTYDYERQKKNFRNIDNFFNSFKNDGNLTDIYNYNSLVKKLEKISKEILIMPLELIQSNKSEYFVKLEEFFNEKVNKEISVEKVNSNLSKIKDGEYNLRELKETFFIKFLKKFYRKFYNSFIFKNKFFIEKIYPIVKKKFDTKKIDIVGRVSKDKSIETEFKNIYKKSNQDIDNRYNLNLSKYDYYN